ncbi:MAG: hypothetical protein HY897_22585 [Deltaproteobacteria bacterium]|nr:hypothetical protein [Deltaproteobacteria bacterium]
MGSQRQRGVSIVFVWSACLLAVFAVTHARDQGPIPDARAQERARLTGFFDRGNFATMTVSGPDGQVVALSISSLDVKVEVIGRFCRTEVT